MLEEEKQENSQVQEEIPQELYAPLNDTTFKKKKKEVVPEYVSYKDVELDFAKKPFNFKKLFSIILFLIVIGLITTMGILYTKNKKQVYRIWLNNETKSMTSKMSSLTTSKFFKLSNQSPFMTSFIVDFEADYDAKLVSIEEKNVLDVLKNSNVSSSLGFDLKKKVLTHTLKSNYNGENLISFYGNGTEDTLSFLIREVTGKYITIPNHFRFLLQENTKEEKRDLENFRKYIVQYFLSNIKEPDIKESNVSLKVDGKEETVRALTLAFDREQISEMVSTLCNKLENNKVFKEKIASYFQITDIELQQYLDNLKANSFFDLEIELYVKGIANKILGYQIQLKKENTYQFLKINGKEENYKLTRNQEILFDLTKVEDRITGTLLQKQMKIIKTDTNTYAYFIKNEKDSYSGTFVVEDTELTLSKKGNVLLTIKHSNDQNQEIANLSLTVTYNTQTLNSLSLYNDEARLSYSDLSETEKGEIKTRIRNTKSVDSVLQAIKAYITKMKK